MTTESEMGGLKAGDTACWTHGPSIREKVVVRGVSGSRGKVAIECEGGHVQWVEASSLTKWIEPAKSFAEKFLEEVEAIAMKLHSWRRVLSRLPPKVSDEELLAAMVRIRALRAPEQKVEWRDQDGNIQSLCVDAAGARIQELTADLAKSEQKAAFDAAGAGGEAVAWRHRREGTDTWLVSTEEPNGIACKIHKVECEPLYLHPAPAAASEWVNPYIGSVSGPAAELVAEPVVLGYMNENVALALAHASKLEFHGKSEVQARADQCVGPVTTVYLAPPSPLAVFEVAAALLDLADTFKAQGNTLERRMRELARKLSDSK